jgi:xylose isomerase
MLLIHPLKLAVPISKRLSDKMSATKKQKQAKEYFPGQAAIEYKGSDSIDPMAFKYYNAEEVVAGKKMKDWLRFAVCWWHTWKGNGADIFGLDGSYERPWSTENTLEGALERVDVHFEFCQKLGVELYCFHDRDVAPEGKTIAESNEILDQVVAKMAAKQKETKVELLWGTCNLFSHPRYMNGACTNPDPAVVCHAAAAVKKCLEVTKKLGGANFVMWGGRDGYQTLLNTEYVQRSTNQPTRN